MVLKSFLQDLAKGGDCGVERTVGHHLFELSNALECDGTGHGISSESVPVVEGAVLIVSAEKFLVDALAREGCRQWKIPRREAFGEAEKIRSHTRRPACQHHAKAPEAHKNLVEYQVNAVLVATPGHGLHEARWLLAHPGGALHGGFEDEAGSRVSFCGEKGVECGQCGCAAICLVHVPVALDVMGRRKTVNREEPRLEALVEDAVVTHAHGAEGVAMVGVAHGDDACAPGLPGELPVLEGELKGDFNGTTPVVGVIGAREASPGEAAEACGEPCSRLMGKAKVGGMSKGGGLLANSFVKRGVAIAVDVCPDGGVAVEISPACSVVEPATPAMRDVQARVCRVFAHLSEGVPVVAQVLRVSFCLVA